jgi:hypothetical protein
VTTSSGGPPEDRGPAGHLGRRVAVPRRWLALGTVVVVALAVGLVDRLVGSTQPAPVPVAVVAAAPAGSESSSWYCTGSTGTPGSAGLGTVLVTNTTDRARPATISVTDGSATKATSVDLGAFSEQAFTPSSLLQGPWLASRVDVAGGGVVVTQVVQGPTGWASSPCSSTTVPSWYFASGSTATGSAMTVVVFNPASTPAVVDLTFYTAKGSLQPQPDEGIVVAPGGLVAVDVGAYLQDQSNVSTLVRAQSGRIVASELWSSSTPGSAGLALTLGAPSPRPTWSVPLARDLAPRTPGAFGQLDVFDPSAAPATVRVSIRLASGPVTPFVATVPPGSTWHLRTDGAARIPAGTDFAVSVHATRPVVVGRSVAVGSGGSAPEWGSPPAVAELPPGFGSPSSGAPAPRARTTVRWVLPAPGTPAGPAVAGASPAALSVVDLSDRTIDVRVAALADGRQRDLGPSSHLRVLPGQSVSVPATTLAPVQLDPLVVVTTGSAGLSEELAPSGGTGVVTLAPVPLS